MRIILFICLSFFILEREVSEALLENQEQQADIPPRGWNSYDSFSWIISEEEFMQNAEIASKMLLPHGYQYVVVDFLWYRNLSEGAGVRSGGFDLIDDWGRLHPSPSRWPSSMGFKGFTEVAKKVHALGLKFGIHVMRGISTTAVNANTLIFDSVKGGAYEESGRQWRTGEIALKDRTCAWMDQSFMSVDTKLGAGRAFLRSLYQQYADWGVDFVKNDCVFGDDLVVDEISVVSEVLEKLDRPVVYSLSPGKSATPAMSDSISNLVNMYRITADDWDKWEDVVAHFDVARDFAAANKIGAKGLKGKSWPDLDMLPFGWLTDPDSNEGPHRNTYLTLDEQKTQMTLCAMAKSPLMYGGDLRKLDKTTLDLITEPTLLEINAFSSNNMEFPHVFIKGNSKLARKSRSSKEERAHNIVKTLKANDDTGGIRAWIARGRKGEIYLAFFNLEHQEDTYIYTNVSDLMAQFPREIKQGVCNYTQVWKNLYGQTELDIWDTVSFHGVSVFTVHCR